MALSCLDMPRSVGVVRPIILAFRAEDMGSNPIPSICFGRTVPVSLSAARPIASRFGLQDTPAVAGKHHDGRLATERLERQHDCLLKTLDEQGIDYALFDEVGCGDFEAIAHIPECRPL